MSAALPATDRVTIDTVETLSDDWGLLRKFHLRYRRKDGTEQHLIRQVYDRGNGAVILLYNKDRQSVILTRQFRLPALVNGHPDGMLMEAAAGLLDADDPESAIRREAEEETGYRLAKVERLFAAYMSPGSVAEQLHFFAAEYADADKIGAGGGHAGEGEDIEVIEVPFAEALRMIEDGRLVDAKTMLLLCHARVTGRL